MVESCIEEWNELDKEFLQVEEEHRVYCQKVDEVKSIQKKCVADIAHQRYRIKQVQDSLKKLRRISVPDDKARIDEIDQQIDNRRNQFRELEDVLPHENGVYLKIVLGSVNVSLLSKQDKYKYKADYEKFKLYVTIVNSIVALFIWFFVRYRVTDAMFQFSLVWYYCTLTIREHILKVNGSRIKGWWMLHHFISTVCAGILLIWPDGFTYNQFRNQFVIFSIYLSIVQLMQYYYQSGTLYRLRALGERRKMDLTVEGFQSWMWKGLSFLLPFLIVGYVLALAIIFLVLFLGNSWTSAMVVHQKVSEKWKTTVRSEWRNKYRFNHNKPT